MMMMMVTGTDTIFHLSFSPPSLSLPRSQHTGTHAAVLRGGGLRCVGRPGDVLQEQCGACALPGLLHTAAGETLGPAHLGLLQYTFSKAVKEISIVVVIG